MYYIWNILQNKYYEVQEVDLYGETVKLMLLNPVSSKQFS